jgi:hypothetical protein
MTGNLVVDASALVAAVADSGLAPSGKDDVGIVTIDEDEVSL